MTSRKGREHIAAEISKEAKEALKEGDGPMWEQIDEAVRMMKGLDDATTEEAFDRRINALVQEKENVQSQIEDLQSQLNRLVQEIEDEQRRKEEYLAERDSIEEVQDEVLDDIAGTTKSVFANRKQLRELARREYGHETDENIQKAITDLKERRNERDLAISDAQFTQNVRTRSNGTADGGLDLKVLRDNDE
jgi:chromosome segregation ATPase